MTMLASSLAVIVSLPTGTLHAQPESPATPREAAPSEAAPEAGAAADADAPTETPPRTALPRPEGHGLVVGGVALVCTSLVGYVGMIVGLGIGSGAESRIASLYAEDDIERRRELIDRGTMGNRLAIGAGVSAAVSMAAGIALIVVGRRRAIADRAQVGVGSLRVRF